MPDGPVYGKFYVERVDGRDAPGGDKENARYFVLDYVNDPYAENALRCYAHECITEYPQLSASILEMLGEDKVFIDKATLHEIEDILEHLIDDTECRYDHHGYCQEHFGGFSENGCTNPRMKKMLEKLENGK